MSIEGKAKEAAGYVKEEINEHGKSPEAQKKAQEDRINKSIERSKAPVQKKTGKPVMFRAPPLVTRKRDKDIKEERDEDEEDLREFLTE